MSKSATTINGPGWSVVNRRGRNGVSRPTRAGQALKRPGVPFSDATRSVDMNMVHAEVNQPLNSPLNLVEPVLPENLPLINEGVRFSSDSESTDVTNDDDASGDEHSIDSIEDNSMDSIASDLTYSSIDPDFEYDPEHAPYLEFLQFSPGNYIINSQVITNLCKNGHCRIG